MSKYKIDEIQIGDLVEMSYTSGKKAIGIVSKTVNDEVYGYWSDTTKCYEDCELIRNITGHWKVINFDEQPESPYTEEEAKVDELKVYTGKEALQALLEGKTLEEVCSNALYRIADELQVNFQDGNGWSESLVLMNILYKSKFTEVATPQVGDWVRVDSLGKYICIAQVTRLEGNKMWADWENNGSETFYRVVSKGIAWQILSPEEVSEYKREQAFAKVGRKLNEFKADDIVLIDSTTEVAVVVFHMNKDAVQLHVLNEAGKGYRGKPHQLTPISFVEQQVDLS